MQTLLIWLEYVSWSSNVTPKRVISDSDQSQRRQSRCVNPFGNSSDPDSSPDDVVELPP